MAASRNSPLISSKPVSGPSAGVPSPVGGRRWKECSSRSDLHPCIEYLSEGGFIQLGLDRIAFARHLEFGKNGEVLLEFQPLGLLVRRSRLRNSDRTCGSGPNHVGA
jgi:hypothetical protein